MSVSDTSVSLEYNEQEEVAKRERARWLNSSLLFCKTLWSEDEGVAMLVEQLKGEIAAARNSKRIRHDDYRNNLTVLLANLAEACRFQSCVAYGRGAEWYKSVGRYDFVKVTELLVKLVDTLLRLGYIEQQKGFFSGFGQSRLSRVWPTSRMFQLFDEYEISCSSFYNASTEVVILRGKKDKLGRKFLRDYEDTDETCRMRNTLLELNAQLERTHIGLDLTEKQLRELEERMAARKKKIWEDSFAPKRLDWRRRKMRRIFNNGEFAQGGRFYGGEWMVIPSEYRKHITINGLKTVEVDYSAIHPCLMYAKAGVEAPEDPYLLSGNFEVPRGLVKKALLVAVNSSSRAATVAKIMQQACSQVLLDAGYRPFTTKKGAEGLLRVIEATHAPICKNFNTGVGVHLQRMDSDIAERVMVRMMLPDDDLPITVLPVHDSFIVPYVWEEKLKRIMKEEFYGAVQCQVGLKAEGYQCPTTDKFGLLLESHNEVVSFDTSIEGWEDRMGREITTV